MYKLIRRVCGMRILYFILGILLFSMDFNEHSLPFVTVESELSRLAKQHSEQEEDSLATALAVFDEALTVLRFGAPEDQRVNEALVKPARSCVQGYLETLNSAFIRPADETPPPPDLDRLQDDAVPTVSEDEFIDDLEGLNERRRKLLGVMTADAWHWHPVNNE